MTTDTSSGPASRVERRLDWVDVLKGLSILWIAYFHLFQEAHGGRAVNPVPAHYLERLAAFCGPAAERGVAASVGCVSRALVGSFTLLGFHAVAVFLVLSGFGLARSLGDAAGPPGGWGTWYRRRLLRLYPLYWAAHGIILVGSWVARIDEPLDSRLALSLTGLRVWPIETIWFYFNPSFWYFTLLVELYAAFPLLWWVARRVGPLGFAVGTLLATAAVRWVLFAGWAISTHWAEGGFFAGRMAEFGFGMALGLWHRRDVLATESRLFRAPTVVAGLALWWLGVVSYRSTFGYCFTNGLVGIGLFLVLVNLAERIAASPRAARWLATLGVYSYGIYLLHQPFVMRAGERLQGLATGPFVLAASAVVAVVVLGSIVSERVVARLTDRVLEALADRRARAV